MNNETKEPSREELYQLVWTKPIATIAGELGISDVALTKRCRKLGIPTPRRGHWAKLEAGKTVIRPKLPPAIGGAAPQVPVSAHHSQWPRDVQGLCPLAQALQTELEQLKPDYEGLQSLKHAQYPKVSVTKPMIAPAARLFHALLFSVEATGVPFRKSRSKYEGGYFELQGERLYLEITEVVKPSSPLPSWGQKKQGSGKLHVTLTSDYYGRGWKKTWKQNEDGGAREIVAAATASVTDYYVERAKKRAEESERQRVEHERWLKEEEVRKKRNHEQALADTAQQRMQDFLLAVEWSHLHRKALEFVADCESRWKASAPALTPEQEEWVRWARDAANAWSPWQTGYPDPANDGSFDANAVPFGGPYPTARLFPRPPTMPEIKVPQSDTWSSPYSSPKKEPYPFWLRHQR